MATLYPHRLIFAAAVALDSPRATFSARVTPAGSASTTAGFNPDLDTSSDFLIAINRRAYLRMTDALAPESQNLTREPISSLIITPSPEGPNPFPVPIFTGFSQILDIRVSPVETVFTIRVENYESIITFETKTSSTKTPKRLQIAAHVTPVPRERDDTVFLNEYQVRIPRWAYDQFRTTFVDHEFSEIGISVDLSNNSPFPSDFPIDDVKIEQGIATVSQGVFRVTLLEYPHTTRWQLKGGGGGEANMRCRIDPRDPFFQPTEDEVGPLNLPAQEFRVFVSIRDYNFFLRSFYTDVEEDNQGAATEVTFRSVQVSSPDFGLGNSLSVTAGSAFDGYEYEFIVDIERENIPFIGVFPT